MELALSDDDRAFELEVRHFIHRHWPESARDPGGVAGPPRRDGPAARAWFDALVSRGWSVPGWPVEHGGTGWSPVRRFVWERETAAAETPRLDDFAVTRLGPLLCRCGTNAQRDRFLPPIREARVRWCQAAGAFSAARHRDHYTVQGENIPTPGADAADWMYCQVQVPSNGSAPRAMACLLIDLAGPGILIRGSRVTLEDVRVPVVQRVGSEHPGSVSAQALPGEESAAEPVAACRAQLRRIARIAAQTPAAGATVAADDDFRRKYARLEVELVGLEALELRVVAGLQAAFAGEAVDQPEAGARILKAALAVRRGQFQQRILDLLVETLGYYALPFPDLSAGDNQGPIGPHEGLRAVQGWLGHHLVQGGSNETQKNTIASLALNL